MNKKDLSERDICSKFIGSAIKRAGWDGMMHSRGGSLHERPHHRARQARHSRQIKTG